MILSPTPLFGVIYAISLIYIKFRALSLQRNRQGWVPVPERFQSVWEARDLHLLSVLPLAQQLNLLRCSVVWPRLSFGFTVSLDELVHLPGFEYPVDARDSQAYIWSPDCSFKLQTRNCLTNALTPQQLQIKLTWKKPPFPPNLFCLQGPPSSLQPAVPHISLPTSNESRSRTALAFKM